MDERTLTALEGSILKWEKIVAGQGTDEGVENCPLCKEFASEYNREGREYREWRAEGCNGCPVAETVNCSSCGRTPYEAWATYTWQWREEQRRLSLTDVRPPAKVFDDKSKQLAQAELDFLKSLLPAKAE